MITIALTALLLSTGRAAEIEINEAVVHDAPKWLTQSRVQKVVDKIQAMLEWNIAKVTVSWHSDEREFEKAHGLPVSGDGSTVLAVTAKPQNTIHIGPNVNASNFDGTFGHELGHVIMYQKYKTAIPPWLEEGLANYASKTSIVDYKWLARQPFVDVKSLGHPFVGGKVAPRYAYTASTAFMEMLASHCDIHSLLQLSVGESLEGYLGTFCGIEDLNAEFQKFVKRKGGVK